MTELVLRSIQVNINIDWSQHPGDLNMNWADAARELAAELEKAVTQIVGEEVAVETDWY